MDGTGTQVECFALARHQSKQKKLVDVTYNSMMEAIKILNTQINLGDVGFTIQSYVEREGFSIVRDFCGHGTGEKFHKEPNVLHYGKKGTGIKLEVGMIFTIEPMINEGMCDTKVLCQYLFYRNEVRLAPYETFHQCHVRKNL